MKKLVLLFSLLGLISVIYAQIPNGFSYQAVVQNTDQTLLKNQEVTIKSSILRNEETIFTQTQTATTNENGLLTIVIGNENFQEINWLQGTLFIKTEIDPTGGNNFTIETQTQLLTVPYAMASKTAEVALNATEYQNQIDSLNKKYNKLDNQLKLLYLYLGLPIDIQHSVWKCTKLVGWNGMTSYPFMELTFYPSIHKLFIESDLFWGPPPNNPFAGTYDYNIDENGKINTIPGFPTGSKWTIESKTENEMILLLGDYNPNMYYFICLTEFSGI